MFLAHRFTPLHAMDYDASFGADDEGPSDGGAMGTLEDPDYDMNESSLVPGEDYNEGLMNALEMVGWSSCVVLVFLLFNILILMGRVPWLPVPDGMFWWYLLTFFATFAVVTIVAGAMNRLLGVNISYTRKVAHFFSFFLPFGLFALFPFTKTVTTYALTFCAAFVAFIPMLHGIRTLPNMLLLQYAYASFDRREDRPFTLMWAVTQNVFVYAVMLPCAVILEEILDKPAFILIPLVVTGIGDGLAEPVGRAFGRHKYRATAMCARKQYTRSIEGSMMLVLSGVGVVLALFAWGNMTVRQLGVGLAIIPVPMAIAEAKSPHSWDNPFLLLVGGVLSIVTALV